jgi:hypothetical protein
MIVFLSVLFKFLQGSCLFCSLRWCYGAIWWLFLRILDQYLKIGDVLLKRMVSMWTAVQQYQTMLLQTMWIIHYLFQRSKDTCLDIALVVKMANLHVAIIVPYVSQLSSWCHLIYKMPLFLNQPLYFMELVFSPLIWWSWCEWSHSATLINPWTGSDVMLVSLSDELRNDNPWSFCRNAKSLSGEEHKNVFS